VFRLQRRSLSAVQKRLSFDIGERTKSLFQTEETMKKQPILTNNKNSVHLAIFEQTSENGGKWYSTTIKRPYMDANRQWQHGSLSREQLEAVVELAQEAIRFIDSQRKSKAKAA
jgi:hypothetical protein